jgi:hypothetical protein
MRHVLRRSVDTGGDAVGASGIVDGYLVGDTEGELHVINLI